MNKKLALAAIPVVLVIIGITAFILIRGSDSDSKIPTVGIVSPNDESAANFIKPPMEKLGYVEGKTIRYRVKVVANPADYDAAVRSLVDEHVDVIYSVEVPGVLAASKLTPSIPIVFFVNKEQFVTDIAPIREQQGIKTNLTGIAAANPAGKRFELLVKTVPTIKTVYVPYNPGLPASIETLDLVGKVAAIYGVTLVKFEFSDDTGAQRSLEEIPQGIDAIFLGDEIPMMIRLQAFADAAMARQVPLAAPVTQFGDMGKFPPGILIGYGGGIQDTYKQVAELIDQILRGTAPADLSIRSSSIYFTVSLGAAEALGIEIPDSILSQANQVINEKVVVQSVPAPGTPPAPMASVACNATLRTPAGESALCVEASCDRLQESGYATFTNKVEVERCSTENVKGVCVIALGNAYYYSGVTATIQSNCLSRGGEWKTSVE